MKPVNVPPLQITRYFDAPRSEVFQWWAEAEKLQQWSGCEQCVASEIEMDFHVGGGFRQNMKLSVNGHVCDFSLKATYEEIIIPAYIRYVLDTGQQMIRVCIEFFEEGATTKVVLTQDGFNSAESCNIVSQGTNYSLDQLHSFVARSATVIGSPIEETA